MRAAATAYRRPILQIAVFIALTGYFAALCVYFSNRRMMWPDEFDGWNLLTDPSWHHMVQSWNRGADGGSLLFYALGRLLLSITGYHVLTMRLFSAVCLWGAAVLWWRNVAEEFFGLPGSHCSSIDLALRSVIRLSTGRGAFLRSAHFVDHACRQCNCLGRGS